MMKFNEWENWTMGEIESLAGKVATGEKVQYMVGEHEFETTFNEESGQLRTTHLDTMEIIESEKDEWFYSDLLSTLTRHLLMAADD